MSYYSNIYIKCKKEKAFEFKHFLDTYKTTYNTDLCTSEEFYTTDNYLYLILYDWKFYDSYSNVKAIINFVDSTKMKGHIGMLIIGEDYLTDEYGDCYELNLYPTVIAEGMDE